MICKSLSLKTQPGEEWRPVVGYNGRYEVSNLGRVKALAYTYTDSMGRTIPHKPHIMKSRIQKQTGYPTICISINGKPHHPSIHRLVAEAFLPNPDNLPCVNHKDEDRSNSILSNLEWCSYQYNRNYNKNKIKNREGWYNNRAKRKRKIYQYTLGGLLVNVYDMWPSEFKDKYGLKIQGCLNHNKDTAGGYVWRYEGDPFSYKKREIYGPQMFVEMYDSDGKLVKTFDGVTKMLKELGTCKQTFNGSKDKNGLFHYHGYTFRKIRKKDVFNN